MRRAFPVFLIVGLLFLPNAAAGPEKKRLLVPVEWFLPGDTGAFVSLPDFGMLEDLGVLSPERIAKRTGGDAKDIRVAIVKAAKVIDGPVTVSFHRESVPGFVPQTAVLLTFFSRGSDEALKDRGADLAKHLLGPKFAKKTRLEEVMGKDVLHLIGGPVDIYIVSSRGHLLFCTSAFTLGRVLREIQYPTEGTLQYDKGFLAAHKELGVGEKDAFLYVKDGSFLPVGGALHAGTAAGRLAKATDGWEDRVVLSPGEGGVLRNLKPEPKIARSVWADTGVWAGADLKPEGVTHLIASLLGRTALVPAAGLEPLVAGPVEVLVRPGRAPVLRVALKADADLGTAARFFPKRGRAHAGSLFLSRDKAMLDAAKECGEATPDPRGAAVVEGSVAALGGALGWPLATERATSLTFRVEKGRVFVSSPGKGHGPFRMLVEALARYP